jgi:hypothetical protein
MTGWKNPYKSLSAFHFAGGPAGASARHRRRRANLAAANAEIGVTTAAFFPALIRSIITMLSQKTRNQRPRLRLENNCPVR